MRTGHALSLFSSRFKGGETGFREAQLRAVAAGSPCMANRGREAAGSGMGLAHAEAHPHPVRSRALAGARRFIGAMLGIANSRLRPLEGEGAGRAHGISRGGHLVVAAAGTGGHVMPGLAVAEALLARGWSVSWLGTAAGMERQLVAPRGIAFDAIDFSGLRGKGLSTLLLGGFRLLRALWQSRRILRERRATMLFSTGGYVAVPAGFAASTINVPLMLLNADAAPLLSTKMLRSLASGVLCGFDGDAAKLAGERGLVTGNPVRADIASIPAPAARYAGRSGPLRVLVIGGSLGAQVLNETVPRAVASMPAETRPIVVHQSGANRSEALRAAYAAANVEAEVLPFIDDMAARYAWADVVICRAGAITVTELTAGGVPSILVPFIAGTTQHQQGNAEFLAVHGAAIRLPQAELAAPRLAQLLQSLTREKLATMAEAARKLGKPDATRVVADAIEHVAKAAAR